MNILIVGAGLYGAVCAHELTKANHTCSVIDKRKHIGGNIYTKYSSKLFGFGLQMTSFLRISAAACGVVTPNTW